jgi:hypothetical protein
MADRYNEEVSFTDEKEQIKILDQIEKDLERERDLDDETLQEI